MNRRAFLHSLLALPLALSGCALDSTSVSPAWLPAIHASRLKEWGALGYVLRHLNGLQVGPTPWYGWAEVTTRIARFQEFGDGEWHTAALIHEAAHVQLYEDGLRYYGSFGEAMADAITRSFWSGWEQRHPADIPEGAPVGDNPAVQERGTITV